MGSCQSYFYLTVDLCCPETTKNSLLFQKKKLLKQGNTSKGAVCPQMLLALHGSSVSGVWGRDCTCALTPYVSDLMCPSRIKVSTHPGSSKITTEEAGAAFCSLPKCVSLSHGCFFAHGFYKNCLLSWFGEESKTQPSHRMQIIKSLTFLLYWSNQWFRLTFSSRQVLIWTCQTP